jgi:hypothetical protein
MHPKDENSWIAVDATVQANTMIKGLEPGKLYYFRHATVQKDGRSDWEEGVSIIAV